MVIVLLVPVVWMLVDDITGTGYSNPNPSFYRGTELVPSAMFALSLFAIYADQELYDFWTSLFLGFVSLVALAVATLAELMRAFDCNTLPVINFTICQSFNTTRYVMPAITTIMFVLVIIGLALVSIWRREYEEWDVLEERAGVYTNTAAAAAAASAAAANSSTANGDFDDPDLEAKVAMDEQLSQTDGVFAGGQYAMALRITLHSWVDTTLGYIGFLNAAVLLVAAVIALRYIDSVAFYRGIYLVPSAFYTGGELAFFMTVRPRWRVFYLIVALVAVAFAIAGTVYDYKRYQSCRNGTSQNQLDADICADDGWREWIIPFTLLVCVLLHVISIVLMIVRIVMGSSRYDRYMRRRAQKRATANAAAAEAASVSGRNSANASIMQSINADESIGRVVSHRSTGGKRVKSGTD